MTKLTEQWKKGELPSGWYYVRLIRGEHRIDLYINGKKEWIDCPDNIIETVVCEVPSYEQWSQTYKTKFEFLEENTKLKELLKEIQTHLELPIGVRKTFDSDFIAKIDQVLGEEQ